MTGLVWRALTGVMVALLLIAYWTEIASPAACPDPSWNRMVGKDDERITVIGIATATELEAAQKRAAINAAAQVVQYTGITLQEKGNRIMTEVESRLMDDVRLSTGKVHLQGTLAQKFCYREVGGGYEFFVLVRYPTNEIEEIRKKIEGDQETSMLSARMGLRRGDRALEEGNFPGAMEEYTGALRTIQEMEDSALESEALNRISTLIQHLDVERVSQGEFRITPGVKPAEVLAVHVVLRKGADRIPMNGVPVAFSRTGTSGTKIATILTDAQGEARLEPERYEGRFPSGIHRIEAGLDLDAIADRFDSLDTKGVLPTGIPKAVFILKSKPVSRSTRVLILLEESRMDGRGGESLVGQALSEGLMGAGFRVVAAHEIGRTAAESLRVAINRDRFRPVRPEFTRESRLAISGKATTRPGSRNPGGVISVHADIFIRAVDLKTGIVVAQKNVVGVAGFGDTTELAEVKALQEAGSQATEDLVNQLQLWEEENP